MSRSRFRHFFALLCSALALCAGVFPSLWIQQAFAGEKPATEAPVPLPKTIIPTNSFDFGKVLQGAQVQHSFDIENQGDGALKIEHIHTACGCTAAVLDSDTVQPHEKTQLRVTFDTTGFQGPKVKTVRIYTNDPKLSSTLFTLQGTVEPDIQLSRPKLHFGKVRRGETPSDTVVVTPAAGSQLTIGEISARSDSLTVASENVPGGRGQKKITVTLKPDIPIGAFRDRVVVKTSSPNNPVVNIPVFAKVAGDVELEPSVISFGLMEGPLQSSVSRLLKLKSRPGHLVRVKNISSDLSGIHGDVVGMTDDGETTIKVTVRGSVVGVFRASLTIETDSTQTGEGEISVPVYGIVSKKSE